MTEARRIVALASAYDIPIIPHGSSIYSYHLQICFPNCPVSPYIVNLSLTLQLLTFEKDGGIFSNEPQGRRDCQLLRQFVRYVEPCGSHLSFHVVTLIATYLTYSRRAVTQGRFCRALEETWIWRDIESRRAQNEEALLKSVMILKNSMNK